MTTKKTKLQHLTSIMGIVSLCCATWAVDITTDTRIDDTNVGDYAKEPLSVSAGATLTIDLAPTADMTFSGAVSGAGKIVVANTSAKAVFFSGSFETFTGNLLASGNVRIRNVWSDLKLNGNLSGVTVEGAAGKAVKFFGKDVFGANGSALSPGHQSGSYSTIDLNGNDQTISLLTFMGCAYDETNADYYKKPTYTLTSAEPATLTVRDGFCWDEKDGPNPTDHSGVVQVNGALSLVFDGSDSTSFTFHGDSTTTGGLTVNAGEIVLADDATFSNLSALTVTGTGRVVLETAAVNAANLALEIADSGTVTLPEGDVFRVKTLKVDGVSVAPDEYPAEAIATLTGNRLTGAAVEVLSREIGETKTFTWIGGGADDSLATAANWQGGVAPTLTGGDEILVFSSGTSATVPAGTDIYGLEITAAGDFTLRGETFRLGMGGLTCGETAAARVCRFEAAPRTAGEQTWHIPANTVVELAAGWAGRSAVTLDRTTGTGDILKFSSAETPAFAGRLTVPNGNVLVLSGRGGLGAEGAHVQLNGPAGVRAAAACVTNRAAITFNHGPALNLAPAGTEFVQLGAMTNLSSGGNSSALAVNGTLHVGGGFGESAAHQGNPKGYEWWTWQFNVAKTGALWIEGDPIAVGSCPFRVCGASGGAGTVHLSTQGNAYGVFALFNGIKAICEGVDALSEVGDLGFYGGYVGSLDLNGFNQTVRDVLVVGQTGFEDDKSSGYSDMYVTSATPATLKLTGAGAYAPNNLNFRGEASLHYAGTGRLALTNTASTTVGSLTVSGGEVALLAGATWANCTNVVVSGSGKLTLDAGAAAKGAFSREATVYVSDGGTIEIPAGETVVVRYLYRDGEPAFSGRYSDGFVTGGGTLRVRKSSRKAGFRMLIK